jgi:hypothetical protein
MAPHADCNLLKFSDKPRAMEKTRDLTRLSDILPTGFHGAAAAAIGIPGGYTTDDPGEKAGGQGDFDLRLGLGWRSPTLSKPARRRC